MIEPQQLEQITAALDAQRQDERALGLYWDFLQSGVEQGHSLAISERSFHLLPDVYRLLYTAWRAQNKTEELNTLVESACQRRFSNIDVLRLIAEGEFQAQRHENALKLYDRLLTLKALDASGFHHVKLACFQRQPFDEFVNLLLHRCLSLEPGEASIVQYLFSRYLLDEKFTWASSAPGIYRQILEQDPGNLTARSALCQCYYRQGKYEFVIEEGELALQAGGQPVDILSTLAKAHYERGEYGRAVTYCRDVLAKRPGRTDIQVLLATIHARNNLSTSEAIKHYQLALRCDPENLSIRQALFRSYLRKLQVEDAIEQCEQILSGLYELYEISAREFRMTISDMISEYERAIRRSPGDISLYLMTAKLHEYLGHFNKALIYYRTILELPLEAPAIQNLIELLEKLATLHVQNPHLYLYLGLLYHKVGQDSEAKLAFRAAMYSDLDEHEVDDVLVRHDRSIWKYPPVLVILAHHRIVTKDILEGLIQTFRQTDHEDWKGVLWVLQELYDIDDLLIELRQVFTWESFPAIYRHILPILAYNGSRYAVQLLYELLSHGNAHIRLHALEALTSIEQPAAEHSLAEAAVEIPYADVRMELARFYALQPTEQATYQLIAMLRDEDPDVRLYVVQALGEREVQSENLREVLFTEQNPAVKIELVNLFERLHQPEEAIYLVHILNELMAKRYQESGSSPGKMYTRLKHLIKHTEKPEELTLLSTLVVALGKPGLEQGIYPLLKIVSQERVESVRIQAIEAIGTIGSPLGVPPLQKILHASSEPQALRNSAEEALARIVEYNAPDSSRR